MKNAPSTMAPGQPAPTRMADPTTVAVIAPEMVSAPAAHPPAESNRAMAMDRRALGCMRPMSPGPAAGRKHPYRGTVGVDYFVIAIT